MIQVPSLSKAKSYKESAQDCLLQHSAEEPIQYCRKAAKARVKLLLRQNITTTYYRCPNKRVGWVPIFQQTFASEAFYDRVLKTKASLLNKKSHEHARPIVLNSFHNYLHTFQQQYVSLFYHKYSYLSSFIRSCFIYFINMR